MSSGRSLQIDRIAKDRDPFVPLHQFVARIIAIVIPRYNRFSPNVIIANENGRLNL